MGHPRAEVRGYGYTPSPRVRSNGRFCMRLILHELENDCLDYVSDSGLVRVMCLILLAGDAKRLIRHELRPSFVFGQEKRTA